ncbi:MAG: tRNA-specific adenosine-34 deaminase [Brockia lithotrophica]|uniref:tRNA-specific adenosine deaminase n=1 Tax=Brockia lithotrophica TaxID=933949 RepID=A0A2T5GB79_9BACL|nr:MAG: tRNA-specific adenosine-34 deaminase [Brockia lithotrophica]
MDDLRAEEMSHPCEAEEDRDACYMREALAEARKALHWGDVPVGAVLVYEGQIVGRGANTRERDQDPLGHAEIHAIREAAKALGTWRLAGTTLYVTLEPCPMCAGAAVQSRISRLVFGAYDPKAGCAGSVYNLVEEPRFNHRLEVRGGVLADEAGELLRSFFRRLRSPR